MAPVIPTPGKLDKKRFAPPFPINLPQTTGILTAQLQQAGRGGWEAPGCCSPGSFLARAVSDALRGGAGRVGCQLRRGSSPIPAHPAARLFS